MTLYDELVARGLIAQVTDEEEIKELINNGKATFYIPGNLAYGANGQPYAGIGPMEMLVFEVEVTDVNAPQVK